MMLQAQHTEWLSLPQVARTLGVKRSQVYYAHLSGRVPEPGTRLGNRRLYAPEDVTRLQEYFRLLNALRGG